ncbi:MAG: U32 family peptidase C-terminal domain-containing protein [Spirochaetales bacterium]|nr:U32 family peptidase C-terminal domain-containing protein [Spirochaetales bacterium]
MELLSPAGNLEKLRIAYRYGADAAYVGVRGFSLRSGADSIAGTGRAPMPGGIAGVEPTPMPEGIAGTGRAPMPGGIVGGRHAVRDGASAEETGEVIRRIKGAKRLYGALNLYAHEADLRRLPAVLDELRPLPLDALIVADIGLVDPIRRAFPDIELHLSTQANCTNSSAARMYHRMGFSRIIAARELSLDEVRSIKDAVPELEVEVFVHGATCMAYSGRCFLSTHMAGRSANRGECAHSCRWNYALVEKKRPEESYPVEVDERFMTILSPRDVMLYDRIEEIRAAGVASIKIEGRMKSALYAAVTAAAYRAAIDGAEGALHERWRDELLTLPHRPYTEGFLFADPTTHEPVTDDTPWGSRFLGILTETVERNGERLWHLDARNAILRTDEVELLVPAGEVHRIAGPDLRDEEGRPIERAVHGRAAHLAPPPELSNRDLTDGIIRNTCAEA